MAHGYDFDLIVIGGGSGGVRAARIAALAGARVALMEEYRMGGTCVIRGCVPKKFMVYGSDFGKQIRDAAGYGWHVEGLRHDFPALMRNIHAEVDRLSGIYVRNLANAGVEIIEARAEFVDSHTVRLSGDGREVSAQKILIATGSTPWRPPASELAGVEHTITSDEIFHLDALPKHLVIVGGGYIAVEFAHVFAGLGVDTCLVYRGDTVLKGFDWDVRTSVHANLKEAGVRVITQTVIDSIERREDGDCPLHVTLDDATKLDADVVMMAVGRKANTEGLGCEAAGIERDRAGGVVVDDWSRSNLDHVWAVGDVTNRIQLTPVAIREGHAFADTEFGGQPHRFDHADVASGVFTQPEVGTVGLTEAEARARHGALDIYKTRFKPMKQALSGDPVQTLMKLVVRARDERVLGVHIVGPEAAEMIQALAIAVKMGVTKPQFDATCAVHPTVAEELVTLRQKWVPDADEA